MKSNITPLVVEIQGKKIEILEEFDREDIVNLGRPLFWNLDIHMAAITQMICADEIEISLEMLSKIPSWYRENYPKELSEIKNIIYRQLYDQFDYNDDEEEATWTREDAEAQGESPYVYPREPVLAEEIKKYNDAGLTPWIFEISPSHGSVVLNLMKRGLKFKYFGKNLNQRALKKVKEWTLDFWQESPHEGQKTILVNFESLEHTFYGQTIEQSAKKMGITFDKILLSTPLHTLGGGLPNWFSRRLGHVKCFSKSDFLKFANESFPGYSWNLIIHHSQVLCGEIIKT